MKVRIEASGEICGTKVLTEEGLDITEDVVSVSFTHLAGEAPRVDVGLMMAPVCVAGEIRYLFLDPRDGITHEVKRIEYADGGSFEPGSEENGLEA